MNEKYIKLYIYWTSNKFQRPKSDLRVKMLSMLVKEKKAQVLQCVLLLTNHFADAETPRSKNNLGP